jgi:hypothetical protein
MGFPSYEESPVIGAFVLRIGDGVTACTFE